MSYAETVQLKISFYPSQHEPPAPGVKIYSLGATTLDEAVLSEADPFVQPRCRVIKNEKKIRVGFLPMRIGGEIKNVYMKQHNALSVGHRLASFFVPSAALRSLAGAVTLLQAGYATAKPLAAVEHRSRGVLIKSFYFSEEIYGAKAVDSYWRENLATLQGREGYRRRRAFLRELARLFSSLHKKNIYHNDLKASNILIREELTSGEPLFSIIDLQGLKRCSYVSKRRRIKNLAQLGRTLGLFLNYSERLHFLKAYGEFPLVDREEKRALINAILEETRRQVVRELNMRATRA
jgi:tRNA A-37 threonylcarbamoyl transferase component Bud32